LKKEKDGGGAGDFSERSAAALGDLAAHHGKVDVGVSLLLRSGPGGIHVSPPCQAVHDRAKNTLGQDFGQGRVTGIGSGQGDVVGKIGHILNSVVICL
jgi:hypothetical protein